MIREGDKGEGLPYKELKGIRFPIRKAERVGFEPTVAKGYTRSPGAPVRPLQHLSVILEGLSVLF